MSQILKYVLNETVPPYMRKEISIEKKDNFMHLQPLRTLFRNKDMFSQKLGKLILDYCTKYCIKNNVPFNETKLMELLESLNIDDIYEDEKTFEDEYFEESMNNGSELIPVEPEFITNLFYLIRSILNHLENDSSKNCFMSSIRLIMKFN